MICAPYGGVWAHAHTLNEEPGDTVTDEGSATDLRRARSLPVVTRPSWVLLTHTQDTNLCEACGPLHEEGRRCSWLRLASSPESLKPSPLLSGVFTCAPLMK